MGGVAAPPASGAVARPLQTAIYLPSTGTEPDAPRLFARARGTGASGVRLALNWSQVAPTKPPTRAVARDPGYEGYRWEALDREVVLARANGLDPVMTILYPPRWAAEGPPQRRHGPWNVDVPALADFAAAAATRYSGRFRALPRVRAWMVWNEPNLATYLNPQFVGGKPASPAIYRRMLNAVADAVHGVRRDNLVVAGGTAPFTAWSPDRKERWGTAPLVFMRNLLCLSRDLRPTCSAPAKFDVWGHHPYTMGGPFRKAWGQDHVSLGDLPKMKAVLDAAVRHKRVASRSRPQFWVTEFSWDTSPPDPRGVPLGLHATWTSAALYQMWRSGVSRVVWLQLHDGPYPQNPFQSGLYLHSGRAKPALQAFRFPFVALRERDHVLVWGRTPTSRAGSVVIEHRGSGGWKRVRVVRANRHGIFTVRLQGPRTGWMRARFARDTARAFSLAPVPDRNVRPFGDWGL